MTQERDLTNDPRVVQRIVEINLEQLLLLTEHIDNSIEGTVQAEEHVDAEAATGKI
jgi:hypothetical protein